MPELLSLYLDIVRFLAAGVVFIGHLGIPSISLGFISQAIEPYGSEAVAVFFVLSGFVIAHVAENKESAADSYAIARLSRLYSVVLIALPLTWIADSIGATLAPHLYMSRWILVKPVSVEGYASAAVFVNEWQVFGFNGTEPGSNGPYWSLSFEATYYVIAGIALFARRWIAATAIPAILFLAGSTITALLPLWALGFALYHMKARALFHPAFWWGLFAVSVAGLVFLPALSFGFELWLLSQGFDLRWDLFPWGPLPMQRNLLQDYLTGLLFAVNVIAVRQLIASSRMPTAAWSSAAARTIRWLGRLTFPLYCLHYPLFAFTAAISPFSRSTVAGLLFTSGLTLAAIIVITPATERLKRGLRAKLTQLAARRRTAAATSQ